MIWAREEEGEEVAQDASLTRYRYTGRERDGDTGLYYYRARWYDSQSGRFLSEDPIGFAGGDVNLYGYVWNSPLGFTDPTGLDGWGNDTAAWLERRIEYARGFYQSDVQDWVWNGSVDTVAGLSSGAADMLRVGSGVGHAIYDEDDNGYGRGANVAMDIARASGIVSILAGGATKVSGKPCSTSKIPWDSWDNYPKAVIGGNEYAQVGNRLYSRHAVERMQPSGMRYSTGNDGGFPQIRQTGGGYDYGRSVAPQYVEDAIRSSRPTPQQNGNISHASGSLQIILNSRGNVVTIITH